MDDRFLFDIESKKNCQMMAKDRDLKAKGIDLLRHTGDYKYTYNFRWLGLPIIQCPQDIIAIQEIIWDVKPTVIIETGVARGGSVIFSASMLHLMGQGGKVIGVDIDIRPYNRQSIMDHPLSPYIHLIEGSSIDPVVVQRIAGHIHSDDRVLVILDSNHTHDHVLEELTLYSSFVKKGSYIIVLDTSIDDMPDDYFPDRPWGPGNNPKTAVHAFLATCDRFEIDALQHQKLVMTVAPDGYLKCVR